MRPPSKNNVYFLLSQHFQSPAPVEFKSLEISISLGKRFSTGTTSTSLPTLSIHQFPGSGDEYKDAELVLMFDVLGDLDERRGLLELACKMLHLTKLEFVSIDTYEFDYSEITDSLAVNWAEFL